MPGYSSTANKVINAVSAPEEPQILLEIDHADLPSPIRVVNYSETITHLGNDFVPLAYQITPPGDFSQGLPRARLSVDNVGRDLTDWIEASNGARGASARLISVLPSAPNTVEWEITLALENVSMDFAQVAGDLAFKDVLNLPGVAISYTPATAPGLY